MTPPAASNQPGADPYAVLGVAPTASDDAIKQAYFAQVRAHPPESDPAAFKQIRAAYEQLRTPEKRVEADMLRTQPWAEPSVAALAQRPPAWDLQVARADIVRAARAFTEMSRRDFREDFREIKW